MDNQCIKLIDKYSCGHYSEIYKKAYSAYIIRLNMVPMETYACNCCEVTTIIEVLTNREKNLNDLEL